MERNARADAIITRFTNDPDLIKQIYQHMEDFQAGRTSLQEIIAHHTKDPELTAKIMANVTRTRAGYKPQSLTGFGTPDTTHAAAAAETINAHKGAVENIVKSKDLFDKAAAFDASQAAEQSGQSDQSDKQA